MNIGKGGSRQVIMFTLTAICCARLHAQLPPDFPAISVTTYDSNKVSPGYIFVGTWSSAPNSGSYIMILNNDGTPVDGNKYQELVKTAIDFKVQPNGLLSYAQSLVPLPIGGGWDVEHKLVDESVTNIVETIQMQDGYVAESHDLQLLPNGNVLQFGYYFSEVDLSRIASGGNPAALVSGCIIQELDSDRNAVFQWRSWDHHNFADFAYPNPTAANISEFHVNDIYMDVDGNIIAGTPTEIRKINRQTGEVMWTLGGSDNEFAIVGTGYNAGDFGGHGTYRLANGNFLEYDNSHAGITSRAFEYSLDESGKVATVVWSYEPDTMIPGFATGNAQRLPNGNTLICWGIFRNASVPICTEVTPSGEKVFELTFTDLSLQSYRAFRFPYPADSQKVEFTQSELAPMNSSYFTNTGVRIDVISGPEGYNQATVTREPYAPIAPSFITAKPPRVLPVRVKVDQLGIGNIEAQIAFETDSFGFEDPENLTVYQRATPGAGLFVALPTAPYNPATREVRATMQQFGEFIFGYPDVSDVAYPPILDRPQSYELRTNFVIAPQQVESNIVYTVNEELPISLWWSPKGFARYYDLQIATDEEFTDPEVDLQYKTGASYVWSNALPDMTYYWRVRTIIESNGPSYPSSDWSMSAFHTVPPGILVKTPNGGEAWQRGLRYFVHWNANIQEDVVLDLYKKGTFLRSITTNSTTHSYRWEVDADLVPGNDYSIRVSSATNAALFDVSDNFFSIDPPMFDSAGPAVLPDGKVQFGVMAPGATQVMVLGSTNLMSWDELQTVTLTNGTGVFVDETATDLPRRFFRLQLP